MEKKKKESRWVGNGEGEGGGVCMPLTITFPVFFYVRICYGAYGKRCRETSPALTVLHKQEDQKRIIINKSSSTFWARNGYVEFTIILNHKNTQHVYLPLSTHPANYYHQQESVIFPIQPLLTDYSELLIEVTQLKEKRRGLWLAVVGAICKHEAKSHYTLNFPHLRSKVCSPFSVA